LISRIKDFLGDNRVHYSQIDQKWIDSFSNYLKRGNSKSEERRFRQGLQPSTLHKKFSFFKQALYRLYNEGLIDDKFKFFKYPKKGFDKKKIVLTGGEIVKIVQYNPESEKLKKVKDLMLMQMMTGLRYSDVMNIRKSTITGDSIEIMNQKTKKITKIPLIESAKSILEKYDYNLNSIRLSNQKYNTYIKEFLRLAGINELVEVHSIEKGVMKTEVKEKYQVIASHSFRRTFITHAVVNNTPIHVIQSFTGHATLKELSGYVSIGEEVKMKEIKKLDSLFNSKQES
jgi:integrase